MELNKFVWPFWYYSIAQCDEHMQCGWATQEFCTLVWSPNTRPSHPLLEISKDQKKKYFPSDERFNVIILATIMQCLLNPSTENHIFAFFAWESSSTGSRQFFQKFKLKDSPLCVLGVLKPWRATIGVGEVSRLKFFIIFHFHPNTI